MKLKLSTIIIGIVITLSLIQLVISHNLATVGEEVRQLEIRAAQLEKENIVLTEEINKIGSLSRVAKEADKLGLVKANQVLHLAPEIPVALSR